MPQFKVPQNLDMEDRLIGKLTFLQFGYLAFGGLIAYVLVLKIPGPFGYILAVPIGLITFAYTFVKVQDQPFSHFVTSLISYISLPRNRLWQHDSSNVDPRLIQPDKAPKETEKKETKKVYTKDQIHELAETIDSHGYAKVDNTDE